jgi:hypothetical protein
MNIKKKLILFNISLILPLLFYRILVHLKDGRVSYLRSLTGLQVHHYHYGVIFLIIAVILLIFHRISTLAIIFSGFGLGCVLDSFISSLFPSVNRLEEIVNYDSNLVPTIVMLLTIMISKIHTRISN